MKTIPGSIQRNLLRAIALHAAGIAAVCCLLVLLLPVQQAAAGEAWAGAHWHTFTADNGLAGNIVQAIWEDPQGHIWFGTENGVSRYDGSSWRTYRTSDGLLDNNVWSIAGHGDSIWFATSSGVSVLHVEAGVWRSYTTRDGLPDNDVRSILVSTDGTVWVGTFGNGIGHKPADTQQWQQADISSQIRTSNVVVHSIHQSHDGALWFGTTAFGALRFDERGWERFRFKRTSHNTVWSVGAWQRDSSVSLATFRGIVHVAADDTVTVVNEVIQGVDLANTEVLAVAGGRSGEVWYGTRARGVFRLSYGTSEVSGAPEVSGAQEAQGTWRHYTTENGLARNYVQTILVDRGGRVWFGTRGGGVTLLDRNPIPPRTLRATLHGQDIQSNSPLPSDGARLEHFQNNLQFTFSMSAPWIPPHDIRFVYWLERNDAYIPPDYRMVSSDPTAPIAARSEILVDLPPGSYTLHVIPLVGTVQGTASSYSFSIGSAPPRLTADTVTVLADAQVVEQGLTLPQRMLESTRRVRLQFAASDDVTRPDQLAYHYRVNTITSTWQLAQSSSVLLTLPRGRHTIDVQAVDADGNRSPPVTITAIVPAPLWQPILIALLLILVPSGISSMLGALGYRRLARRQALRRAVSGYLIPYDVGPLITLPDRYIGRRHILDTILGKIDNNSFYITGEKRIGKTSLLLLLKQRLLQRNTMQTTTRYVPVFRNMQDLPQEQFWLYLVRSIAVETPDAPDTLIAYTRATSYDDFDAESDMETIVQHAQTSEAARCLCIVLLLDEVDTLQRYDPNIRQRFRAFCQHMQRHLRVVLAGVLTPHVEATETSPWYNIFEPITLGPLARDDTLFLIRNYNQNPYSYTPEAEQAILSASGGKPFATQWICSEAVKVMLATRRTRVTLSDVEQAIQTVESERAL